MAASTHLGGPVMGTTEQRDTRMDSPPQERMSPGRRLCGHDPQQGGL